MNRKLQMQKKRAFTLIELLVVIAIIALLLSVVMPSLKLAKEAGKRTLCLFNVKSLTIGWMLYAQDYDGRFPKGWTNVDGWIRDIPGYYSNPEDAPAEMQREALEKGLLFPYLETTNVFRCPIAQKNELRTYSMPQSMNGFAGTSWGGGEILTRINQIKKPGNRITFLDDYIYDWDACWMVYYDEPTWWNITPIRHGSGGNVFSFADGHSDFHAWKDRRTIELAERCNEDNLRGIKNAGYTENQPGNEDLVWVQRAVWGKLGY
jgi:prepilin-type N-terminal cleavage/methylation domain-containing protein